MTDDLHAISTGTVVLIDQEFTEGDLRALRNAATAHADSLGLPPDMVDEVELIVAELASNAVRHGGGGGRLRLAATGTHIVCEVTDRGAGMAALPALDTRPDPAGAGGRGLWLVHRYADQLTLRESPGGGTVVTATLRRTPG